jgi:hypothetical protein
VVGFVRSKPSAITCYLEHYLLKTGLSGLTAGDPVYLTDAGGFGAAAGTVSKTIGYAIDTDEALLSASPAPGGGTGDHGALSGLADDDHTQYLLAAGTRALSAAWDAGSWQIRAETFQSDVATGTPPLTVASTTAVTNLNADLLDGNHAAAFALAGAAPTAHAASHVTGGADIIAVATTSAVGLTPAATAPGAGLLSVLAIANGETVRTDKAIFDTTNPAALGSAGPGSQVVAARRDHVHAMPSAADVGAIAVGAAPTAHAASHVTGGGDTIADAIAAGNSGLMSGADKTKLNNIEAAADVTDATNVDAAGAVMNADYTAADVVLVGTGVGTVGAVTLAASQFLGKKAAGAATNLTATEARTILNVADGANAYVHPNHSGDVTSAADGAQTISQANVDHACNGRLTLETGVPISTTDQTAKGTLYFTPYAGNRIALFDGSVWSTVEFTEKSLDISGYTADKPYDIWGYNNAGALALESTIWTNTTTRATAIALQDGVYVKSGTTTRRYLGTILMTATLGQCEDSRSKRYVWNYYNRVPRNMYCVDTTNSWTYTTATWRAANNNTTLGVGRVACVIGCAESLAIATLITMAKNNTAAVWAPGGIGINATNANSAQIFGGVAQAGEYYLSHTAHYRGYLAVGYNYLQSLEYSDATGATTWYGDSGTAAIQTGMCAEIDM